MQCTHESNRKIKLVSWAVDFKGGHKQGFNHVLCCSDCGIVIPQTQKKPPRS